MLEQGFFFKSKFSRDEHNFTMIVVLPPPPKKTENFTIFVLAQVSAGLKNIIY